MKQEAGRRKQEIARLVLVKKPVQRVEDLPLIREASSGSVVLPRVWAVGEPVAPEVRPMELASSVADAAVRPRPEPELAFYRKYTEGLLRRYLRLAMAGGRVPALLGRELFRSKVTSYRISGFDDLVIFCSDIERCLKKLKRAELELVWRIAIQEYTQGEAACLLGISLRTVARKYPQAIDRLTGILLAGKMLEPQMLSRGHGANPAVTP